MVQYEQIGALVREAGGLLLRADASEAAVYQKEGLANFCTEYDVRIQRFLIEGLSRLMPQAAFYGEEDTEGMARSIGEYTFYIDPIDGTTNFMFSYRHSCISVGLAHQDRMLAGFVYNPFTDQMYTAVRGQGSFLNGRRLQMADKPLSEGIVAFGCARYNEGDTDLLFASAKELYLRSLSIRNGGSATIDLCRVASGSNVVYLELRLQPYDYAAASVIIEEAGGLITQANGDTITLDQPCSIVAGTPRACAQTRQVLRELGYHG